jgi:hypothetical protein
MITVERYLDGVQIACRLNAAHGFNDVSEALSDIREAIAHSAGFHASELGDLDYSVSIDPPQVKVGVAKNQYYLIKCFRQDIRDFLRDAIGELRGQIERKQNALNTLLEINRNDSD